jgi:hypothetical protein
MARFFHNKSDLIFWAVAVVLFVFLAAFSLYSAAFFAEKINTAFNAGLIKGEKIVNFNLNQAKRLKR